MYNAIIMYKLINLSIIYYVLINILYKSRCRSKNHLKKNKKKLQTAGTDLSTRGDKLINKFHGRV